MGVFDKPMIFRNMFGASSDFQDAAFDGDDESNLLWSAVGHVLKSPLYLLRGLDMMRQGLWTLADKGSAELGAALGTRTDPVPTWGESWDDMYSGRSIVAKWAPEFERENPYGLASAIGLGLELAGDPSNLVVGPLAKTAVGAGLAKGTVYGLGEAAEAGSKGAAKALKLISKRATNKMEVEKLARKYSRMLRGATWATQAKHGQRALLSLYYPTKGAQGWHFAQKTLLGAPRAVAAAAKPGRAISKALQYMGAKMGTDFFAKTLDPTIRRMQEIARERSADVHVKLLKVQDEMQGVFGKLSPDDMEKVARAAEHYARPGAHRAAWAAVDPATQNLARQYHAFQEAFWEIASRETGIERPQMGGKIKKALAGLQDARLGEIVEIERRLAPSLPRLGKGFEKTVKEFVEVRKQAQHALGVAEVSGKFGDIKEAQRLQAKGSELYRKLMGYVDATQTMKARVGQSAYIAKLDAKIGKLSQALDSLPNYVMHNLTAEGKRAVHEVSRRAAGIGGKVWNDAFQGQMERQMADIIHAGGKKLKRSLAFDEIETRLIEAMTDAKSHKMKKYAEAATGWMDWVKWKVFGGKTPTPQLSKMYDMNLVDGFQKMTNHVVHAFESQQLIDLLKNTDLVSVANKAADGWVPLSQVSGFAFKRLSPEAFPGAVRKELWIAPELHRELRRTYTRMFQPESLNRVVRAWDKMTKAFKTFVTVPESWLPGKLKYIPIWLSYHFRNNMSDFMLMSYNGAFNPKTVVRDGVRVAMGRGKVWCGKHLGELSADEVRRMAIAHRITWGETKVFAQSKIGMFLEDSRRLGYFVDRLQRGYSPFQAAMDTKRVLFDYGALSDFERTYMKRIIPFWSWLRNITKVSATQILRHPAILKHQLRLRQGNVPNSELPPWIRGRLPIALDPDKRTGEEQFLMGLGLPIEDVADLLDTDGGFKEWAQQFVFSLNPGIKLLGGIGKKDYPQHIGSLGALVPENMRARWGIRKKRDKRTGKTYYTIDADRAWILQNALTRFYSTLRRVADPRKPGKWRMISYLTGIDIVSFDRRAERRRSEARAKWKRIFAAQKVGDAAVGKYIYRPQGSLMSDAEYSRLR